LNLNKPLIKVCQILKISRASVYYAKYHPKKEDIFSEKVLEVFEENLSSYGRRRLKKALEKQNIIISEKRISKILKNNHLEAKHGRKKLAKNIYTADKEKYIAENLIKGIKVEATNTVWGSDTTEFKCKDGVLYASGIIDVYDKTLVNLSLTEKVPDSELAQRSLRSAINEYGAPKFLHTDRGSIYTSKDFKKLLKGTILQSMSKPHSPNENQYIETFWKTLKTEIGRTKHLTKQELKKVVSYYVFYYNTERMHSSIGYVAPLEKRFSSQINI